MEREKKPTSECTAQKQTVSIANKLEASHLSENGELQKRKPILSNCNFIILEQTSCPHRSQFTSTQLSQIESAFTHPPSLPLMILHFQFPSSFEVCGVTSLSTPSPPPCDSNVFGLPGQGSATGFGDNAKCQRSDERGASESESEAGFRGERPSARESRSHPDRSLSAAVPQASRAAWPHKFATRLLPSL